MTDVRLFSVPPVIAAGLALLMLTALPCPASFGQGYSRHNLVRGDMAPGLAAESVRMSDPALGHYVQPVRIFAPEETMLEVVSGGGLVQAGSSRVTLGLSVGPVYRLKVSGLRLNEDRDLYPTIELLGRLYPPAGLENQFPIEIEITRDDLLQAIDDRLVTKVIYLEHGDMVIPHRHFPDTQPTFDVSSREDPLLAAQALGRPMAILRIGSRVPLGGDMTEGIHAVGPQPMILPEPMQVGSQDQQEIELLREAKLPPIVRSNRSGRLERSDVAPVR